MAENKKVMIGMSGGVDSSVAAFLLQKESFEVIGATMKLYNNEDIDFVSEKTCCSLDDVLDAKSVCARLGIRHYTLNMTDDFKKEVIERFISAYQNGFTPNPCIDCNRYMKFSKMLHKAQELDIDYVATGHYARIAQGENGRYLLKRGVNPKKDQSYFLAEVKEEQLKNALFPLADLTKVEVRKIADEMNLAVAKKKDSTGVCFIGERNFKAFLSNYLPAKRGDIVDIVSSRVIGKHDGVLYYTVGQHRGLDIGGIQGYKNEPFFVVGKDVKKNILYVAQEENDYMYSYKCKLTRVNLIMEEIPSSNFKCKAKFRYRGEDKDVELEYISEDEAYLHYNRYKYIAKGQIAVLYLGERCLGGGVIDEIYREDGSRIEY